MCVLRHLFGRKPGRSECLKETSGQHRTAYRPNRAMLWDGGYGKTVLCVCLQFSQDVNGTSPSDVMQVSHGLQLQSLCIIPTAAVS